ncbi:MULTISPECIES: HNH endonuclease [unclassified Sphingomonas]|uniref:HNH endonuclease n=1 Tax=unclassified Sphingomonas TaxID=196159 RepID=UPI001F21344F|nr:MULTISPECIES: HNH endonuclease [unclassified Sphingomonas]
MAGRVKRKAGLAAAEALVVRTLDPTTCALCRRPIGTQVEWHHRVPKSEGGRETVPVHPICHRTIHASATNTELAGPLADLDTLRDVPAVAKFVKWVADKPADFRVPVRQTLRSIY